MLRTAAIALVAVAAQLSTSADAFAIGGLSGVSQTTTSRGVVLLGSTAIDKSMDMEAEIRREVCLERVSSEK